MGWKCPCGMARNFASKTECFKCHEPKGDAEDYELPALITKEDRKKMAWKCLHCKYPKNF